MGSVKLVQSWFVSFRPFLLKAALANNHHHVMAQLLKEWGACYCQALEKLEAHFFGEQGEEQPSALAADDSCLPSGSSESGNTWGQVALVREAQTQCLGHGMDYRVWRAEHWKDNISHLMTSPSSPLTSPEDNLHPTIESQAPPV